MRGVFLEGQIALLVDDQKLGLGEMRKALPQTILERGPLPLDSIGRRLSGRPMDPDIGDLARPPLQMRLQMRPGIAWRVRASWLLASASALSVKSARGTSPKCRKPRSIPACHELRDSSKNAETKSLRE